MEPKDKKEPSYTPQQSLDGSSNVSANAAGNATGEAQFMGTPQRWGILPTRAFWSRRDVTPSTLIFLFPLVFVGSAVGQAIGDRTSPLLAIALGTAGVLLALVLGKGLLERYIRGRRAELTPQEREELFRLSAAPPRGIPLLFQLRVAVPLFLVVATAVAAFWTWRFNR